MGGLGFIDDDFEKESSMFSAVTSTVAEMVVQAATGTAEAVKDLSKDVTGAEKKTESNGGEKFPTTGSLEGFDKAKTQTQNEQLKKFKKEKTETDRKKVFFQTLKEEQEGAQREKERLLDEEIDDIVATLPTEQKNKMLHYQMSYKDKSIYQKAELRKKLIEERKKAEKQEKEASIPSPAKQPSAMEGAFEGRSGTQGGGTANLSNQAVG